ncbi:MAG: hypothetical protein R3F31_16075 [Verrucomicrobiales bacterium]
MLRGYFNFADRQSANEPVGDPCSVFNWCSQIRITRQFFAAQFFAHLSVSFLVPSHFFIPKLPVGLRPAIALGHPCQKHPSTKTALVLAETQNPASLATVDFGASHIGRAENVDECSSVL